MLLIAAALMEELEVALGLFPTSSRLACKGVRVWTVTRQNDSIHFLKTGVGPERSGNALGMALCSLRPSNILVIGYAGALNPEMKLGNLAVVRRVFRLGGDGETHVPLGNTSLTETWNLTGSSGLLETARSAGVPAYLCDCLTSPHIIGEPAQKRYLRDRFGVSVIDMETAALAHIAAENQIPLACVRSVSDEADDAFLAPFTYDPSSTPIQRVARLLSAGNWIRRYGEWRERASVARGSLRRFLTVYLSRTDLPPPMAGEDPWQLMR